MEGEFVEQKK